MFLHHHGQLRHHYSSERSESTGSAEGVSRRGALVFVEDETEPHAESNESNENNENNASNEDNDNNDNNDDNDDNENNNTDTDLETNEVEEEEEIRLEMDPLYSPNSMDNNFAAGVDTDPEQPPEDEIILSASDEMKLAKVVMRLGQLEENNKVLKEELVKSLNSGKDETKESSLNQECFSFLISSKPFSVPFNTAIIVFMLKNTIFYLVMANLVNFRSPANKIAIPAAVDTSVTISQFVALLISVVTQNDLINALIILYEGYAPSMAVAFEQSGGGKRPQWVFAVICTIVDGVFGLAITFMLVVTSSTVLDVILNFAAVEFVSNLNEAAFFLSRVGFLGNRNQQEADLVERATFVVGIKSKYHNFVHSVGMIVILLIVVSLWMMVFLDQINGKYTTKLLIVQFDDDTRPELAMHSGFYNLKTRHMPFAWDLFHYTEEREGGGEFGYCRARREWTFTVNSDDPCDNEKIFLRSVPTASLDIQVVASETWFVVRPSSSHSIPMQNFQMFEGCKRDLDCGDVGSGLCSKNRCICKPGNFGLRCEYTVENACKTLQLNELYLPITPEARGIGSTFEYQPDFLVYERPVYFSNATDYVMMFTGLRWVMTRLQQGFGDYGVRTIDELRDFSNGDLFHASSIMSIGLVSEPVYFHSDLDVISTPIDLSWALNVDEGPLQSVIIVFPSSPIIFLCGICNNSTNPCFYGNQCFDGTCDCVNGGTGTLCQVTPVADAKCDDYFNTEEFSYDGGDCCELTCVDLPDQVCGRASIKNLTDLNVGFPFCRDSAVLGQCEGSTKPCFSPNGEPVLALTGLLSFPVLSANGRILAVAEPRLDAIRVFDKDGSAWIQRGSVLQGARNTLFGASSVGMATFPGDVKSRRINKIPVYVAAAETRTGIIRVFEWGLRSTQWHEGPIIPAPPGWSCLDDDHCVFARIEVGAYFGPGLGGATDESPLVTVLVEFEEPQGRSLYVYQRLTKETEWREVRHGLVSRSGLSEDGLTLVVQGNQFDEVISITRTLGQANIFATNTDFAQASLVAIKTDRAGNELTAVFNRTVLDDDHEAIFRRYVLVNSTSGALRQNGETTAVMESFHSASISADSTAVLLVDRQDEGNYVFRTFSHNDRESWLEYATISASDNWQISYALDRLGPSVPVSISSDGSILADGSSSRVSVYGLQNLCNPVDEATFHLSIVFDGGPRSLDQIRLARSSTPGIVNWEIRTAMRYKDLLLPDQSLGECDGCYDEFNVYAWTSVAHDVCVPRVSTHCLVFLYETWLVSDPVAGFAAYLNDNGNSQLFALGEGDDGADATKLHDFFFSPKTSSTIDCPSTDLACSDSSEVPLVVAGYNDIDWWVLDRNQTTISSSELRWNRLAWVGCVSKTSCFEFRIATQTELVTSTSPTRVIYYDHEEVSVSNVSMSTFFGDCSTS